MCPRLYLDVAGGGGGRVRGGSGAAGGRAPGGGGGGSGQREGVLGAARGCDGVGGVGQRSPVRRRASPGPDALRIVTAVADAAAAAAVTAATTCHSSPSTPGAKPTAAEMSHQVTITRTTTTTSGTAIIVNTGFVRSWGGLLKLAETILAAVCVGIAGYYISKGYIGSHLPQHPIFYFILATFACLVGTFSLLFASFLSLATSTVVSKTLYEVVYHFLAFLLTLSASLNLLIQENDKYKRYHEYDAFLAASIIGLVLSGLYLFSVILGYRSYKLV